MLGRMVCLGERICRPWLVLALTVFALAACPSPDAPQPQVGSDDDVQDFVRGDAEKYTPFKIFWATNRAQTGETAPAAMFSGQRGPLIYGTSEISVPYDHEAGQIERPSYWRFEFREDSSQHMVLLPDDTKVLDKAPWFRAVEQRAKVGDRKAFVFIHGFNTTFEDAALRTAQIGYDLSFSGAPILYSWPSKGSALAYAADENDAEWSEPDLVAFLKDLREKSGAADITLIAHSMGSRLLGNALKTMSAGVSVETEPLFNEIILSAPDIDADVFKTEIMPAMLNLADGRTLYASSEDSALILARDFLRGGLPRAGDAGDDIVVMPDLDTIDATGFRTDFLDHSDASSRFVLADMFYIVHEGRRAWERALLREQRTEDGSYWRLAP